MDHRQPALSLGAQSASSHRLNPVLRRPSASARAGAIALAVGVCFSYLVLGGDDDIAPAADGPTATGAAPATPADESFLVASEYGHLFGAVTLELATGASPAFASRRVDERHAAEILRAVNHD